MSKATQPRRRGIWSTGFLIRAQMLLTWYLANNVTWDRKLGAASGSKGDGWLRLRFPGGWGLRGAQGKGSEAVLLGRFAEGIGLGAWVHQIQPPLHARAKRSPWRASPSPGRLALVTGLAPPTTPRPAHPLQGLRPSAAHGHPVPTHPALMASPQLVRYSAEGLLQLGPLGSTAFLPDSKCLVDDGRGRTPALKKCEDVARPAQRLWDFTQVRGLLGPRGLWASPWGKLRAAGAELQGPGALDQLFPHEPPPQTLGDLLAVKVKEGLGWSQRPGCLLRASLPHTADSSSLLGVGEGFRQKGWGLTAPAAD